MHTNRHRIKENEETGFQTNKQDKPPDADPNETEVYDLPAREAKTLKMFTEIRITHEHENFNKENTKNYQTQTMMLKSYQRSAQEEFTEETTSKPEDISQEIIQ